MSEANNNSVVNEKGGLMEWVDGMSMSPNITPRRTLTSGTSWVLWQWWFWSIKS